MTAVSHIECTALSVPAVVRPAPSLPLDSLVHLLSFNITAPMTAAGATCSSDAEEDDIASILPARSSSQCLTRASLLRTLDEVLELVEDSSFDQLICCHRQNLVVRPQGASIHAMEHGEENDSDFESIFQRQ